MKKIIAIALSLLLLLPFTACDKATKRNDKLQVTTSFYTMYDFAKLVGGDKADITLLCPSGQEPHDFEPTAKDMARLADSDVFVYNGMGMEHWADSVIDTLPESVKVVCTSDYAKHKTKNNDPHVWLNPHNAYSQMEAIADVFIEKDPYNADYYKKNLAQIKQKRKRLNENLEIASDMFARHTIIVSHDAYSHLCDVLDITAICVNGTDNAEEPSPQRVAEIEDYIKNNDIKYIYTEPLGTSDIIEAIAKDTGCEILVLDPFEGGKDNKTYFNAMIENIASLTESLNPAAYPTVIN